MKMKPIQQDAPCLSGRNGSFCIRVDSIYYVEVLSHIVTVHTEIGSFSFRGSLAKIADDLPKDRFFKCSQSYLINLAYTKPLGDTLLSVGGDRVPLSRAKKRAFWEYWDRQNSDPV